MGNRYVNNYNQLDNQYVATIYKYETHTITEERSKQCSIAQNTQLNTELNIL